MILKHKDFTIEMTEKPIENGSDTIVEWNAIYEGKKYGSYMKAPFGENIGYYYAPLLQNAAQTLFVIKSKFPYKTNQRGLHKFLSDNMDEIGILWSEFKKLLGK